MFRLSLLFHNQQTFEVHGSAFIGTAPGTRKHVLVLDKKSRVGGAAGGGGAGRAGQSD